MGDPSRLEVGVEAFGELGAVVSQDSGDGDAETTQLRTTRSRNRFVMSVLEGPRNT